MRQRRKADNCGDGWNFQVENLGRFSLSAKLPSPSVLLFFFYTPFPFLRPSACRWNFRFNLSFHVLSLQICIFFCLVVLAWTCKRFPNRVKSYPNHLPNETWQRERESVCVCVWEWVKERERERERVREREAERERERQRERELEREREVERERQREREREREVERERQRERERDLEREREREAERERERELERERARERER